MKAKKGSCYDQVEKCLKFSLSKDETRPQLTGIYHDAEMENAVSLDGVSCTVSKMFYNSDFKGLIVKDNLTTIKRDFPKYLFLTRKENIIFSKLALEKKDISFKKNSGIELFLELDSNLNLKLRYERPFHDNYLKINAYFLSCLSAREYNVTLGYEGNLLIQSRIHFEIFENEHYFFMPMNK